MVDEEWWDCTQTSEYLGITINHLRQLQHRGKIRWKRRVGRSVYYLVQEVRDLSTQRSGSKQG